MRLQYGVTWWRVASEGIEGIRGLERNLWVFIIPLGSVQAGEPCLQKMGGDLCSRRRARLVETGGVLCSQRRARLVEVGSQTNIVGLIDVAEATAERSPSAWRTASARTPKAPYRTAGPAERGRAARRGAPVTKKGAGVAGDGERLEQQEVRSPPRSGGGPYEDLEAARR